MEEEKIYTGKTYEEALNNALMDLALPQADVEITVVEEGKKKLFGSTKWKIKAAKKETGKDDGKRAADFIKGLLEIMGIKTGDCNVSGDEESIHIEINTVDPADCAKVIGKRGDVLDAIQCMAGAVANIGREKYVKVVVDCENYRSQREAKLTELAHKVEKKAVETGRKIILEPMNPYERRIIHSALVGSEEVETASEGKEPKRYVVVVPKTARPGDRGIRYGEKRDHRNHDRERGDRDKFGRRSGGRDRDNRGGRDRNRSASGGAKRAKKEIVFGTFLGNSGAKEQDAQTAEGTTDEE